MKPAMKMLSASSAVALLAVAAPAVAGTASGTLDVTMTVANNCTLISGGAGGNAVLDFGNQNAGITTAPINGSSAAGGDITLNCTGDTPTPQIEFSAGTNANGSQRRIVYDPGTGTPSFVEYNLYIDSGRANPLTPAVKYDLVPDSLPTGLVDGLNSITVYGQIPPGQTLTNTGNGSYSDSVTFQITY
jgi:spore coat protein U-like protein